MTISSFVIGDFKGFILQVDEVAPDGEVVNTVIDVLAANGIASQLGLEGLADSHLDAAFSGKGLCAAALAKRALWAVNTASQIKRQKRIEQASSQSMVAQSSSQAAPQQLLPASEVQQITDIVGVDISAAAVAKILAEPQLQVDVPTALKAAQLDGLAFHLQPEHCVWRLLESENKAATKDVRTAFSYVDLTSKPFLPLWLPQDTIGGKHMMGSDWAFLDPTTTTGTLQQLGAALKAVSSSPRFFRSFPQWLAAFFKYAVVAVGTKQLTWPQVLSYVNVVCELQEKQRAESGNPFLAMLYDDVLRKQISHMGRTEGPDARYQQMLPVDRQVRFGSVQATFGCGACASRHTDVGLKRTTWGAVAQSCARFEW